MFQGSATLSVDTKGRMTVPARIRDSLVSLSDDEVVVTAHPHGCLVVYPLAAWIPFRDKVFATPALDPRSAGFRRLFIGLAEQQALDSAGRIMLSPALRKHAKIDKHVLLMGQGDHYEVWSEASWDALQEQMASQFDVAAPAGWDGF